MNVREKMEYLDKVIEYIKISEELLTYVSFLIVFAIIGLMWYKYLNINFMSSKAKSYGLFLLHLIYVFFFSAFCFFSVEWLQLIYIYTVPPVVVTTVLLYSVRSREDVSFQIKSLCAYKYSLMYLFLLLLANNKLSGVSFNENVIYATLFVLVLAATLDEITNINERYLMYLFFLLTISSGIAIIINYKYISFAILLLFWLLPQVKIKTKLNLEEKRMTEEVDIHQVNWLNKYISQVFFLQLLFREKLNSLQKDAVGVIVYTLVLVNFFFY